MLMMIRPSNSAVVVAAIAQGRAESVVVPVLPVVEESGILLSMLPVVEDMIP